MAVRIRLKRIGTTNTPAFRIVVADGRSPRDGKFIEEIGSYTPSQKENTVALKLDRAQYWLSKGAQPSATVASFIRRVAKQTPVTAAAPVPAPVPAPAPAPVAAPVPAPVPAAVEGAVEAAAPAV
jgi:small subunit ribosomal protein S16